MTFEELWKRYYADLVDDLVRFGRRTEDAEELASDGLSAVWPRIDEIEPKALWKYLRVTTRRLAINQNRNANAQRRDARKTTTFDDVHEKTAGCTPEDEAIAREQLAAVYAGISAVMATFPDETKLYVAARYRGLSNPEIAKVFGVSVSAVQSRLYRATEAFEKQLGRAPKGITWIELAGDQHDHKG
ncbi:MAG TPA: sigma-70 family RNA polymerase sigma factor [Thermoanaerobaculia bacterium]|nr:sigma-70 family RNA polymerase sigma factor [Thermoanaerobaculia bacterium]